jgi:hypothetical protein
MQTDSRSPSRELELALARVAQADRQLVSAAEMSYRRARSAAMAGAVAIGIGAALIGTLGGSSGAGGVSSVLGAGLAVHCLCGRRRGRTAWKIAVE